MYFYIFLDCYSNVLSFLFYFLEFGFKLVFLLFYLYKELLYFCFLIFSSVFSSFSLIVLSGSIKFFGSDQFYM